MCIIPEIFQKEIFTVLCIPLLFICDVIPKDVFMNIHM